MPHENEILMRRLYDAASTGDVEQLQRIFQPDVVWHVPGQNMLSGEYKGFHEVMALFARLAELTNGTFRSELHDVVAGDEHAVGLHTERAERKGRAGTMRLALIAHVRDGQIAEVWEGHTDLHDFEAFWTA